MKSNAKKCHLLVNSVDPVPAKIGETVITNSKSKAFLGVTVDSELKVETHILNMCNKASQKLHTISRI